MALLAFTFGMAGCGGSDHAIVLPGPDGGADAAVSDCPHDLPAACPSPAPSWDGGVEAIIDAKCVPCHQPGGLAFDRPF
ncbi:MAG TPA: hypothetical protein VIA18_18030, partial [Polyangia bacterium]|nr:hypothetical protein [Polyangia bacterium]